MYEDRILKRLETAAMSWPQVQKELKSEKAVIPAVVHQRLFNIAADGLRAFAVNPGNISTLKAEELGKNLRVGALHTLLSLAEQRTELHTTTYAWRFITIAEGAGKGTGMDVVVDLALRGADAIFALAPDTRRPEMALPVARCLVRSKTANAVLNPLGCLLDLPGAATLDVQAVLENYVEMTRDPETRATVNVLLKTAQGDLRPASKASLPASTGHELRAPGGLGL